MGSFIIIAKRETVLCLIMHLSHVNGIARYSGACLSVDQMVHDLETNYWMNCHAQTLMVTKGQRTKTLMILHRDVDI